MESGGKRAVSGKKALALWTKQRSVVQKREGEPSRSNSFQMTEEQRSMQGGSWMGSLEKPSLHLPRRRGEIEE